MGDHLCKYEERWGQIKEHNRNVIERLDSILEQALLTNGRLRKLETFRLAITVGIGVAVSIVVFMLIAHEQGWVDAIIQYGK